ncbi:winged helix-turn-helix domain-containing protein [Azorhizobium doebereinerae]|uniref:winged helix-turn-helix domain-containing protein n=1 Tax=Azorhizobium doebereinerae TaxID=281091 RepID=UPI000491AC43|nr:winged helix-turn-helix domain-containing protein [Azorhizobium doebereinerae]
MPDATDTTPSLFLRLDFGDGRRLGPGKIALLEAIGVHGSILSAAKAVGMSYRRAWLLMDELDRMFEETVIVTHPGRRGSGTDVTPFGHRLIALYRAMERQSARATEASVRELSRSLAKDDRSRQDAEPEPKAG